MKKPYPITTNTMVGGNMDVVDALANGNLGREFLSETVPEFRSGAWSLLSWRMEETRRHRGRYLIFGRMSYRSESDGRIKTAEIVTKVHKKGPRGDRALRALRQLWEAGLRAPNPYRVPRLYGYLPERDTLVQERVQGVSWADLLQGEDRALSEASVRAADWLIQLQSSSPDVGNVEAVGRSRKKGRSAENLARDLFAAFPRHAMRLEPVTGRMVEILSSDAGKVPSHGDYHPENVYLAPEATTVIDFDNFGLREAAYDVGYAMGQALIMSYLRLGRFGSGALASLTFWRRYESTGPATWDRVVAQVARTFLQSLHYELCALRNGRVELIEPWTEQMEGWLESEGPNTLEDLIRRS